MNALEKRANKANNIYRKSNQALILKVPVPVEITRFGPVLKQSTVDYTGLIDDGTFFAFDAKETQIETRFPLKNIKQHQLIYLNMVEQLNGIAFFLIHFKLLHKDHAYITPLSLINHFWHDSKRKSIPIASFDDKWLAPIDDYLPTAIKLLKK